MQTETQDEQTESQDGRRRLGIIAEVENEGSEVSGSEESKHSLALSRQPSTTSLHSIMSQDFLSKQDLFGHLRQSKSKKQDKDVNVWSPFTIGTAFPLGVSMVKKRYTRGELPDRGLEDPLLSSLNGGLILDLPDENIDVYLGQKLDLQYLPLDEELIAFLEDQIDRHLKSKTRKPDGLSVDSGNLSAKHLVEMPGFESVGERGR